MSAIRIMNADDDDDLSGLNSDQLRKRLADLLGLTAPILRAAARVWAELERRGEDMTALRSGIRTYLPAIAAGTVLPEVVVACAGRPSVLRKVAELPPAQQREVLDKGVPVYELPAGGGAPTHRVYPLASLIANPSLARQVFGERCVNGEAAQVAYLRALALPRPPKLGTGKAGNVAVDGKAGTVRIGKAVAGVRDVIAALKAAGVV